MKSSLTGGAAVLAVLTLAAVAVLGACAPSGEPGRHVVLILLDAARPDRFGAYDPTRRTTPNLDALARRGAVFRNHFSQATETRGALPRLLYSRYFLPPLFPHSARVPFSHPSDLFRERDAEAISLPAALAAHGFHTAMISAHTWLKPETEFAREFAEVHDLTTELALEQGFPHPRAEAVVDFALDWLHRQRERDVFLYLHLMDTHSPRFFDDDAAALFAGGPDAAPRWMGTRDRDLEAAAPLGDTERDVLDAIYDGSLRYTDRQLGRLLDLYREWGVLERTLIALASDHGELLLERPGVLGHGGPWYDLVARVPWIVSYPDQLAPRRIESPSESVDLAPTLLGLLDLETPAGKSFDGVDRLDSPGTTATPVFGHRALRVDGVKVIFDQPDEVLLARKAPEPSALSGELYDLAADPGETVNLWRERPELVAAALASYRERLARPYARYRRTRTERQPDSSFAIAARHFRTERPVPTTADPRRPAAGGGWVLSDHWRESVLMALPNAAPLAVELELPDGTYELSAAISAGCEVRLPDLEAPATRSDADDLARFGEIEVHGQTFRAILVPKPGPSSCSISYLGFRPAGAAGDDAERDERLRALGYVN